MLLEVAANSVASPGPDVSFTCTSTPSDFN